MIANTKLAVLLTLLLSALLGSPARAQSACITFEPPPFPLGTTYGAPVGQVSGDLAFVASGISGDSLCVQ